MSRRTLRIDFCCAHPLPKSRLRFLFFAVGGVVSFLLVPCSSLPLSLFGRFLLEEGPLSAMGKWGRTQMGSDRFNQILTGFYFFDPVGVRLAPLKSHDSTVCILGAF